MTSTRLTQQTRSREWAAALRAATHRPYRPNCIARSRQLVARLRRRIQHDTQYIHPVQSSHGNRTAFLPVVLPQGRPCTRPTHAHGWAGGCCVVGAPTRSPLGPARGGGETARILPRAIERDQFAAPKASRRPPSPTKPCLPIPSSPANLSQAGRGRHESGRALLLLLSPLDLIPPRLAPSWPLRWA